MEIKLQDLEIEKQNISFESFGLIEGFKNSITSVQTFLSNNLNFIQTKLSSDNSVNINYKNLNEISSIVSNVPYMSVKKIIFPAPVGLKTNLKTYVEYLFNCSKISNEIYKNTLLPYKAWLLKSLGNPDFFKTKEESKNMTSLIFSSLEYSKVKKQKERYNEIINSMSVEAHLPYGKLIERNGDWNEIYKLISHLNLKTNEQNQKDILKIVDEITELHDKMLQRFINNNNYKPSQEFLQAISESVYHISEEVEFFALTQYRLKELLATIDLIVNKIKEDFKN